MAEEVWPGDRTLRAVGVMKHELDRLRAGMDAAFSTTRLESFRKGAERSARATGDVWERVWDRMADRAGSALDKILRTGRLGLDDLMAAARDLLRVVMGAPARGNGQILADVIKGGIATIFGTGAPPPVAAFAKGGIARGPQVAVFGEGTRPEAFVPLPDGRSIPVRLQEARQPAQAIQITQHFHGEAREASRMAPVMKRMVRDAVIQGQREARRTG